MAVSKLAIKLTSDTGASSSDGISKIGTFSITGANSGSKLFYQIVKTGEPVSTNWLTVSGKNTPSPSSDGNWTVYVQERDSKGKVINTVNKNVVLDTTAQAPVVTLMHDNGVSDVDLLTNDGSLAITSETGAKIQYSLNGGKTWSSNFNAVDGLNNVLVRQTDLAGNTSLATNFKFTLDTQATATAPSVSLALDSTDGNIGHNTDLITNQGDLLIGNLEAGATVQYSTDNGITWSELFVAQEGLNQVLVKQLDAAGNSSPATAFDFTLDTQVQEVSVALMKDSGNSMDGSLSDNITNTAFLNVGNLESGSSIQYSLDGVKWLSYLPVNKLKDGEVTVWVRQTDAAGNSSMGNTMTFTLDRTAQTLSTSLANDSSDGNPVNNADGVTNDSSLQIDFVEEGAIVEYSTDNGLSWQTEFTATEGANTLLIRQTDLAGNQSKTSTFAFTLDTSGPDTGVDGFVVETAVPTVLDILFNDSDTHGVSLLAYDTVSANGGTLTQNIDGTFTYIAADGFTGNDTFSYQVSDAAGNQSTAIVDILVQDTISIPVTPTDNTAFTQYNPDINTPLSLTDALLANNGGIQIDESSVVLHASANSAVNFYDGSLAALGIGAGILLTSGTTPGTSNTSSGFGSDNTQYQPDGTAINYDNGDADLDSVVNTVFQTQSYDATTLAFNFTVTDPTATSISFNLVFGSDEYPEWVDAFVDSGIVLVNGQNVALFNHDAMAPLSVIGSNLSAGYFQDNQNGTLPIEYDGVSKVLTIVAPIHQGSNSIKIGIGDTGDHILDSGIFLSNFSAGNWQGSGVLIEDTSSTSLDDTLSGSTASDLVDLGNGNDSYSAGAGDDIVDGGNGNDTVSGGSGTDTLTGGSGNDDFDYTILADWAAINGDMDTITDFSGNQLVLSDAADLDMINGDVIVFDYQTLNNLTAGNLSNEMSAGTSGHFSTLSAGMLSSHTDGSADQAQAQFVYDQQTGILSFDTDGTGSAAAMQITLLGNLPSSLAETEIVVQF